MSAHRILRRLLALLLCLAMLAGGLWWGLASALPDTFYITGNGGLRIASMPWVAAR